jgi:hypothetical protein
MPSTKIEVTVARDDRVQSAIADVTSLENRMIIAAYERWHRSMGDEMRIGIGGALESHDAAGR